MDFSNSISRKHPAESTNFTTPVKRRRTTVVHTPVPQNARSSMFNNSQNFSFTSSSSAEGGVPSTAPRLPMNVPITPGQPRTVAPDMGAPNTVGGNRTKLLEPRSFAPRPLQSPFAARSMRNRKSTEPGSRFLTQLRKQQAEAAARPTAKADPALPVAMSPSENPPSSKGLADSINGSRVATSSATAVQTPTPARRIHKPNFRSERKPSPRPSGSSSMYHFGGNTNTLHLPFFGTSAQSPTASSPSAPESRLASFVSKSSSGETAVRADGIINFLASSIEKAKQALAGNRADRNEERKEKEKEAIRKKIEEEQRIKRDEIFKAEIQHEKNEREEREREEREQQIRETEDKGKNMERDWFVDGAPSFVTEDTILDPVDYTLNEFHEATFVEEASIQNQNPSIITSSPIVGFKDLVEQSTSEAQNINHGGREVSSEESEEEEEVEEEEEIQERLVVKDRPKSKPTEVICIDSSSEDEGEDGEIMQEAEEEEGEEEDEEDDEDEDDDEDEEEEEDEDEDETVNMKYFPSNHFSKCILSNQAWIVLRLNSCSIIPENFPVAKTLRVKRVKRLKRMSMRNTTRKKLQVMTMKRMKVRKLHQTRPISQGNFLKTTRPRKSSSNLETSQPTPAMTRKKKRSRATSRKRLKGMKPIMRAMDTRLQ
ncbi:hypothetical protein DFP73DRAFT_172144 [Morchella snyderi]|nr:hypothetical protein DFP73DRAFT_172144 [Morchella snyderi]